MKTNYTLILLHFLFIFGFTGCEKDVLSSNYVARPKTEVGNLLVDSTDLIASIYSDSSYTVTEGFEVTEIAYLSNKGQAMKIFISEIDLDQNVNISVSMPNNKAIFDMQPMTEQAFHADSPERPVMGGVNGDFYNVNTGMPRGIFITNSTLIKNHYDDPLRTFFGITEDGKAIVAGNEQFSELQPELVEAVGAGVRLIQNGNIIIQNAPQEPRTAVGVSEDQETVYFVVVDGRNWSYSNGMNYADLSTILKVLGSENAVNLDGGGSSTFFVRNFFDEATPTFDVRNWPSDNGGQERAVANGILFTTSKQL